MDTPQHHHHSHLFTVRLWREDLSDGRTEWRGQVRQIETGETSYFRDWPTLVRFLLIMLPRSDDDRRADEPDATPRYSI